MHTGLSKNASVRAVGFLGYRVQAFVFFSVLRPMLLQDVFQLEDPGTYQILRISRILGEGRPSSVLISTYYNPTCKPPDDYLQKPPGPLKFRKQQRRLDGKARNLFVGFLRKDVGVRRGSSSQVVSRRFWSIGHALLKEMLWRLLWDYCGTGRRYLCRVSQSAPEPPTAAGLRILRKLSMLAEAGGDDGGDWDGEGLRSLGQCL